MGVPTAAAGHHRTAQVKHAALPAVRAQLPQHFGKPRREGPLVCSPWPEDVGRSAAFALKVHGVVILVVVTPPLSRLSSQQSPSSHYYVQHTGTGSRRIMPRSGSDQHLPHTEYSDYTSITQAGRHSLLRSSLKSGSTLSRYNQRYVDQAAVAAQLAQAKYGTAGQYGTSTALSRRNRSSLDYSSDTEAIAGPRSSYYYYRYKKV